MASAANSGTASPKQGNVDRSGDSGREAAGDEVLVEAGSRMVVADGLLVRVAAGDVAVGGRMVGSAVSVDVAAGVVVGSDSLTVR